MNGQLWEPCPRCKQEPVCADCGYCERHCGCEQARKDRAEINRFQETYPEFLARLSRYSEEQEKET